MFEPSIVAALKNGFQDHHIYYDRLHSYGIERGAFFDKYLGGHVVVDYQACREIYRNFKDFGRNRVTFPEGYFSECDDQCVLGGYRTFKSMSIFQDTGDSYAGRRQKLLEIIGSARKLIPSSIEEVANAHAWQVQPGTETEIFINSLRPYAAQCATVALVGKSEAPEKVTNDALSAANFLDGKRVSKPYVLEALCAIDRLGDWISSEHAISRKQEYDVIADLVLLYVAAHESLAYLLYICLTKLASESALNIQRPPDSLPAFVGEAMRFDSPVQVGGRVVVCDVKIGDSEFRAGEKIFLHLGAANRDGRIFDNPGDFIENRNTPHLAFGWGSTRCVGSEYATGCAIAYISALRARFNRVFHVKENSTFDHGLFARGLKSAMFIFS